MRGLLRPGGGFLGRRDLLVCWLGGKEKEAHFVLVFHLSTFAGDCGSNGPGESSIVFNSGSIRSGGGSGTGGSSGGGIAVGILNDNEIAIEEGVCGRESLITP